MGSAPGYNLQGRGNAEQFKGATLQRRRSGYHPQCSSGNVDMAAWPKIFRCSSLQVAILRSPALIQQLDRGGWSEIWIIPLLESPNNFLSRSHFNDLNS